MRKMTFCAGIFLVSLLLVNPAFAEEAKENTAEHSLKRISGKICKYNAKSVIPTLELEGKPGFVIMVPEDTQAAKVVGENLTAFKPKEILKDGLEVAIWYEEKGYIRTARIITIQGN